MTYIIRTPNPDFDGIRAGLVFRRGTAETDDPAAASYCQHVLGYTVEQIDLTGAIVTEPQKRPKRRDE